jgi:hypothetical protein
MELSASWQVINCMALLKKFPTVYGTWMLITMFTRAHQRSISWARPIQYLPAYPLLSSILVQKVIHNFRDWCYIWSETNFGPTSHHHPQSSPLLRVYTIPSMLAISKCILKPCSVRVFNTAYNSASITSFVSKWRPFSFIINWGNREE